MSPRLPARRGQTDDDFDSDAWDDATAAREAAQDEEAARDRHKASRDAGALRSGSDGNAAAGQA